MCAGKAPADQQEVVTDRQWAWEPGQPFGEQSRALA